MNKTKKINVKIALSIKTLNNNSEKVKTLQWKFSTTILNVDFIP